MEKRFDEMRPYLDYRGFESPFPELASYDF
jgi:hypothetical protein